jgi:hypothetical protein
LPNAYESAPHTLYKTKRDAFISGIEAGDSVVTAAASVGFSRRWLYDLRKKFPEFAAAWDDALMTPAA